MNYKFIQRDLDTRLMRGLGAIAILGIMLAACAPAAGSAPASGSYGIPAATTVSTSEPASTTGAPASGLYDYPAETTVPASGPAATTVPPDAGGATGVPSTGGVAVNVVKDASLGDILVDGAGLTLYKWASDSPGKSNCDASCMAIWPPLLAQGALAPAASLNTGDFGVTQTTDGRSMVTYKGLPLYYYVGDKNPGDTKGNLLDIGGIWTVVAP